MRLIKLALLSVVILFLIATAISLLIPSHIRISKAINVRAEKDSIFAMIKDTSRWVQWHPAFMPDDTRPDFPAIHFLSTTTTDSSVVMQLQQADKDPVTNSWTIYQHQGVDSLTLQWYMDFHLKWYPWKKFASLFFENTYGSMMEKGLDHMKQELSQ